MRPIAVAEPEFTLALEHGRGRVASGPRGPELDPAAQVGDLLGGQFPRRRHFEIITVTNSLEEQALFGLARHEGRAAVAASQNGGPGIKTQVAPLFLLSVAPEALLRQ